MAFKALMTYLELRGLLLIFLARACRTRIPREGGISGGRCQPEVS